MVRVTRLLTWLCVVGLAFGCGGSNSGSGPGTGTNGAQASYFATLPDGTTMLLELDSGGAGTFLGEFTMSAETGAFAEQDGLVDGTVTNGTVMATGFPAQGTSFQIAGTSNGSGFQLTRTDLPGVTLNFQPVQTRQPALGPSVNFLLTSGTIVLGVPPMPGVLNLAPVYIGPSYNKYAGTVNGQPCEFTRWSTGLGTLMILVYSKTPNNQITTFIEMGDIPTLMISGTGVSGMPGFTAIRAIPFNNGQVLSFAGAKYTIGK